MFLLAYSHQRICHPDEDTSDLSDITDQKLSKYYTDTAEYTFFLAAHGTVSKIYHVLSGKLLLNMRNLK